MSFLDHIRTCNRHDLGGFRAFLVGGERVGWVRHALAEHLRRWPDRFAVGMDRIDLADRLDDFDRRSTAIEEILPDLIAAGFVKRRTGEFYPVTNRWGEVPRFKIDRGAIVAFGCAAYGVHMNGFVRTPGGLKMWVARRAATKPTYPGQLDNIVAGGQPIGLGPTENLIKECGEEAGIPPALAATAKPIGAMTYCLETPEGLRPDVAFLSDLELPADFVPVATDGEVEAFMLWPVAEAARVVDTSFDFKFNCNLVIIDFLIRHGLIGPDHPDYVALVRGLHAPHP
jgi:8-oxo-dGTP pyrophosphatase MutT (NUDIX family)